MSDEGKVMLDAPQVPSELAEVLDEINERFESLEDRRAIADWLNRVADLSYANVMSACEAQCMRLPVDGDGVPCVPGDVLHYPDEPDQEFSVIAVDGECVFYDMGGGNYPTSIAVSTQLAHAGHGEPKQPTREDALAWFEEHIAMVDTAERRDEVYQRTLEMLDGAAGGAR